MNILVTGGAGYIGSHVVRQLGEAGHDVVVVDNLCTGHEWAVLAGRLEVADFGDRQAMERVFAGPAFDAVMHFAAHLAVGESVAQPLKYYRNNTSNLVTLLELCVQHGVPSFVFSSTCAVYGLPEGGRVTERTPLAPISPYGASKMMAERMLMDTAAAVPGLRYAILRYFNVAGADPELRIGQATRDSTQLIKVACEVALGRRPEVQVFGTDYPTRDGTGVRDYIHVEDLARAHLDALDYLAAGGDSQVLNCGYGRGFSVREVLEAVRRVSGRPVPSRDVARRAGDPAEVVADNSRIRKVLGWAPRHDDLDFMVRTAWEWERKRAG
jgi:UDP-glucose 4-epimerase